MKTSPVSIVLVAALVAGAAVVLWPFAWIALYYGCQADEDRLAAALAAHPILTAHPVAAEPRGRPHAECENDDAIPYADQTYRFRGAWGEVASFYREAAAKGRWRPYGGGDGSAGLCFTRTTGGLELGLFVSRPPEGDAGEYTVTVSAATGWLCGS
ncbi:hypothetical protein AB0D67_18085 [Streptosporangium sp. NPDC048047]|uniref:hypothetical protein n=1 Tax=Streptosporangium sp. NPDC048047 TaxID=3155748 RepID=UPI0034472DB9